MRASLLGCILLVLSASVPAQDTGELEKRVTDFTLPNGLRFVIMERHQAPVISFQTHVGGGSVNDPAGQTGLSYLVSRLAYKGTEAIGSRNWAEEKKKALDAMDEAYERMEAERNKGPRMKPELYDTLRSQWRLAVDAAQRLGDSGEFNKILSENGVTNAHATGTSTSLQAGYTLPSNRLELWFAMESQRLIRPVLREFDLERNNLMEEQAKSRSAVHARVLEALLAAAFTAHPYRVPTGGWSSDLAELKRSEARDFVEKHFVPGNIVIGIAGDVDPAEARRLADKYFGPMPARPMPPVLHTAEPPQNGPRLVELAIPSQAITAIGYKRPNYLDKDDVTLDVIQTILGDNNGGLAFRELIQEKKLATAVQVAATYPDGQYPCLFTFVSAPAAGQSMEQLQKGVDDLVARLRGQKVGDEVLAEAKAQTQARAYQRLASTATLAEMLAVYTASYGDWKKLFSLIDDIAKVTEDDVMRAAQRYLIPSNRTTVTTGMPVVPRAPRAGGLQ